jgi:hypothetical protein
VPSRLKLLLIILLYLGSLNTVSANSTQYPAATLAKLAEDVQWQYLLHFRPTLTGLGKKSQADDSRFLLAPNGAENPAAELIAFWLALNNTDTATDVRCRFPARYEWLVSKLPEQVPPIPESNCPKLTEWVKTLNAKYVSLVFAASYLNSPSSMFGHTFLRIDPPDIDRQNLILANTISYAADSKASDNELTFAYRGIFGGYPGITTVEPYYKKIKIYSDIENRDLWEYQLNLTPAEVHMLIRAAWEIQDIRFDYYFFDENCAYRILALIDIARPSVGLIDALSAQRAIPSDTVRVVVAKDLVESIHYRPSAATSLSFQIDTLNDAQKNTLFRIIEAPDSEAFTDDSFWQDSGLTIEQRVQVLDTAYDLVRYRVIEDKLPRDPYAAQSFRLLKLRSQYSIKSNPPAIPEPERDDTGHKPFRFGVSGGQLDGKSYLEIEARPAYHSLSDPSRGYRSGAHLEFLNTAFRWYPEEEEVKFEHLNFVEIYSFSPRTEFFDPLSWHIGFGGRRSFEPDYSRPFTPYIEGGAGPSWQWGNHMFTLLGKGEGELSKKLSDGGHLEIGAELHWLYVRNRLRTHLSANSRYDVIGENEARGDISAKILYELSPSFSAGIKALREKSGDAYENDIALVAHYFF